MKGAMAYDERIVVAQRGRARSNFFGDAIGNIFKVSIDDFNVEDFAVFVGLEEVIFVARLYYRDLK